MNIALSADQVTLATWAATKRNSDNPQAAAWTAEEWLQNELAALFAQIASARQNEFNAQLRPIAAALIEAPSDTQQLILDYARGQLGIS